MAKRKPQQPDPLAVAIMAAILDAARRARNDILAGAIVGAPAVEE